MKHLFEFNQFNLPEQEKYTVVSWSSATTEDEYHQGDSDVEEIEEPDYFNVTIEDESGNQHTIQVNYQMFIEHLQEQNPKIQSYLSKFDTIDDMVADLEELGFDFEESLQSWVDYNVSKDTLDVHTEDDVDMENEVCDCCAECTNRPGCDCGCDDCMFGQSDEDEFGFDEENEEEF